MKKGFSLLSSFVAVAFIGVFAPEAEPMPLEKLVQAAQREGIVNHTETRAAEVWAELEKRFNNRFGTKIKINQLPIQAAEAVTRLREEAAVGRISMDLYRGSGSYTYMVMKAGLLAEPFDWVDTFGKILPGIEKLVGAPRVPKNLENRIVLYDDLTKGVIYNKKLVAKNEVPRKWEELLDPKWRGRKIAVDPRGSSTYGLALFYGKEWALDFNRKLKAQNPLFVNGTPAVAKAVSRGEALLGAGVGIKHVLEEVDIDIAAEIPLFSAARNIMPIHGSPHLNAARLWAAWYAVEGVKIMNKEFNIYDGLIEGDYEQARFAQKRGIKYKDEGLTEEDIESLAEMRSLVRKILAK